MRVRGAAVLCSQEVHAQGERGAHVRVVGVGEDVGRLLALLADYKY